jgi:hypothetical protein
MLSSSSRPSGGVPDTLAGPAVRSEVASAKFLHRLLRGERVAKAVAIRFARQRVGPVGGSVHLHNCSAGGEHGAHDSRDGCPVHPVEGVPEDNEPEESQPGREFFGSCLHPGRVPDARLSG